MSAQGKRNRGGGINYVEIDSDFDKSDDESGVEKGDRRKAGDTFGTVEKPKGAKRRKSNKIALRCSSDGEGVFLGLNFDVFTEICDHLDIYDIISLARVDKDLHGMLAEEGGSIWKKARERAGFASLTLPPDMSEAQFAWLVFAKWCQVCAIRGKVTRNFGLRTRLCGRCSGTVLISSDNLKAGLWQKLHPRAIECVPSTGSIKKYYRIDHLESVQHDLLDLQEEDEMSTFVQGASESTDEGNLVDTYVADRRHVVEEYKALESDIDQILREIKKASRTDRRQEYEERQNREVALRARGWTQAEVSHFSFESQLLKTAPTKGPAEDAAAWTTYHNVIKESLRVDNERQERWKESSACREASTPFFKAFTAAEPLSRRYLLPPDHWIGSLPSFKAMWTDSNKSITQAVWDKHLPSLRKDFDRHAERTRIQAIRFILSAQRDVPISALSRKPSDYPESTYNSHFFSRVTSLLTTVTYRSGQPLAAVSVYPSIGSFGKNYHGRQLEKGTGYRQVALLREIAKAAGLDPETTTCKDLRKLNGYFIWVDHPKKKQRNQHYSWMWLLGAALRSAPCASAIRAGQTPKFKFVATTAEEA